MEYTRERRRNGIRKMTWLLTCSIHVGSVKRNHNHHTSNNMAIYIRPSHFLAVTVMMYFIAGAHPRVLGRFGWPLPDRYLAIPSTGTGALPVSWMKKSGLTFWYLLGHARRSQSDHTDRMMAWSVGVMAFTSHLRSQTSRARMSASDPELKFSKVRHGHLDLPTDNAVALSHPQE